MAITKEIVNLVFIVFTGSPLLSLCLILHMDGLTCLHILEFSPFTTAVAGIKDGKASAFIMSKSQKAKLKIVVMYIVFLLEISSLCP